MRLRICIVGFVLFGSMTARAQESLFPVERQSYLVTESCYQIWRIQNSQFTINQLSLPLMLYVPFGDRISMTVSHIPAYSKWGNDYEVTGFSDTWVQGSYLSGNEKWALNLGMGIPTGKTRLNNNEFFFTQSILSENVFQFRLPIYGQGFSLKVGGLTAYPILKNVVLGIGGQYLIHAVYHPVKYNYSFRSQGQNMEKTADVKYKPGNELTLQLGMDIRFGENTKFMLDGMYSLYEKDMLEQKEIYGTGAKLAVHFGLYYKYDEQDVVANVTYRQKGKNEQLSGLTFEKAEKNLIGDQVDLEVLWSAIRFRDGSFYFIGDGRFYGRNDNQKAGAIVYGGGMGVNIKFLSGIVLNSHLKYVVGNLKDAELIRNIEGMEVAAGLKFKI